MSSELGGQFPIWMYRECLLDDRVWTSLETIWKEFSKWRVKQKHPPVTWEQFTEVIAQWQLPIQAIGDSLMVRGLGLKVDTAQYLSTERSGKERR